ncbi:MAG: sugar phosphate isomerase/epimerase [Clostridiales bacterium]|nr:sugar phosphate isomerase/epimerase [Clostridiales bacterium]
MNNPRIAAQLYTVREYMKTADDIEKGLKKIKDMGYNAVQVSGIGKIADEALKDLVDEIGLKICVTHIPFDRMQNDIDGVIKQHKLWDCDYVGLGSMPMNARADKDSVLAFAKEANEIGRVLADNGLRFVYHNHAFEFAKFDGKTIMDILLEETDENFGFEIDTYWVQAGGANPVDWIYKVEGRMDVVHFKDMGMNHENKQMMTEVGEGNLNWVDIIKACNETGVKWAPVEQDICQRNPFESLEISLNNLIDLGLKS